MINEHYFVNHTIDCKLDKMFLLFHKISARDLSIGTMMEGQSMFFLPNGTYTLEQSQCLLLSTSIQILKLGFSNNNKVSDSSKLKIDNNKRNNRTQLHFSQCYTHYNRHPSSQPLSMQRTLNLNLNLNLNYLTQNETL